MNKYVLWCNQRNQYYQATNDIKETIKFESLKKVKDFLLEYHNDIDDDFRLALSKANANEIANEFDWEIKNYNGGR